MYSNNILNFQASMTILNACTKESGNLLKDHVFPYVFNFKWLWFLDIDLITVFFDFHTPVVEDVSFIKKAQNGHIAKIYKKLKTAKLLH